MIEVKADKIIFNVASSPSASGANGLDLLKAAPKLTDSSPLRAITSAKCFGTVS